MKKYELTAETITIGRHTLHRIKALRSFGDVKEGDFGGFIESEANLSHDGNAWVFDEAKVYHGARVYDDAIAFDEAKVYNGARVFGESRVGGNAWVKGMACIFDEAKVDGTAIVGGEARVCGNVCISGNAVVIDGVIT